MKKILRDSRSETSSFKNIKSNPTPFSRKSNDNKLVYIIINQLKNENLEQKKLNLKQQFSEKYKTKFEVVNASWIFNKYFGMKIEKINKDSQKNQQSISDKKNN